MVKVREEGARPEEAVPATRKMDQFTMVGRVSSSLIETLGWGNPYLSTI